MLIIYSTLKTIRRPIDVGVSVPGSKSYSLRALFISSLCDKSFAINNILESSDIDTMKNCLKDIKTKKDLHTFDSGIATRFITALACISPLTQVISGSDSLNQRPIKDLVNALRGLGAKIEYLGKDGFPPIKLLSSKLSANKVKISGATSSQFLSALLLIAPTLEKGLEIYIDGEQISKPYVDMTIDIMQHFGVEVLNENYKKYTIKPQKYQPKPYVIEGDYSSAGYFFAIAALNNSKITVNNLNPSSKQADINFLPILEKMGATVEFGKSSVTVTGKDLKPIDVDMNSCPDQAMTVAVLCAFAPGTSKISGIKSLRVKETERIIALENELAKMGIKTESTEDSLTIFGGKPEPTSIETYGDHRLAMSFAVAGTRIKDIEIMNPDVVNKTFPGFWIELGKITEVKTAPKKFSNIVLIGMRGSGKTTAGRLLAKKLNKKFVELDDIVVQQEEMSIPDIVSLHGWDHFRDIESKACESISNQTNAVISTGGGVILRKYNVANLKKNAIFVFLKSDVITMEKRTANDPSRPALSKEKTLIKEIESIYSERKDKYYKASDFVIDTSLDSPDQVVDAIMDKL